MFNPGGAAIIVMLVHLTVAKVVMTGKTLKAKLDDARSEHFLYETFWRLSSATSVPATTASVEKAGGGADLPIRIGRGRRWRRRTWSLAKTKRTYEQKQCRLRCSLGDVPIV